ncbi:MAG: hypothetical protein R3190_11300, partial [Thermoanaerobaculia bacterium]|nr:hypothetical protein [Thermoanaerobaculia bacterium]
RPAIEAFYERNAPAASATGKLGAFRVTLVATESAEAFLDVWDRRPTAREPEVWTLQSVAVEQDFWLFFLFEGCTKDAVGSCAVGGDFEILRPDDSVLGSVTNFAIWLGPSPPDGHLQPSQNNLSLRLSEDEKPGAYRVQGSICDASRERCVEIALPLRVEAGG